MGGYGFLALYVLAPEKFVASVLASTCASAGSRKCVRGSGLFGLALLDLCGVAALGAGLGAGSLPPPLAVGYSVTALAALCFGGLLATTEGGRTCAAFGAVLAVVAFGASLGLGRLSV